MRQVVVWALEHHQIDHSTASATAATACREICKHWGGEKHWLPTTCRPARNAEILAAARNGVSIAVISTQLDVSESTVRRIVRRQPAGLGSDEWVL